MFSTNKRFDLVTNAHTVVSTAGLTLKEQTSREQPKSAPYLRLKIAKGVQNVKVLMNLEPFMEKQF